MGQESAKRSEPITGLLSRWRDGDGTALSELMPLVYSELRRVASRSMLRERAGHTLQTTALVHETYLRLAKSAPPSLEHRTHFYSLIARLMRHVLVDHARAIHAGRRGGGSPKVPIESISVAAAEQPLTDVIALDEALDALKKIDPRKARTIELRFFGGLDVSETAKTLNVSKPTVVNDTRMARAWLYARVMP